MRFFRIVALPIGAALLVFGSVVSAHEGREIGDYEITFGWQAEPAYTGQMNGPEIFITLHEADGIDDMQAALEALTVDLEAEVTFGDQSVTLSLDDAVYETYGEESYIVYSAPLIPALPGDYVFQITGTIDGIEVDETFDSADGEFSTVEPLEDILFPVIEASDTDIITALETRIADLEARLAALETAGS